MKNHIFSLLLLCALPAAAADPGGYDYGMEQRQRGDYAGAKATFMKLLLETPSSGGALEGLALSCLALRQYAEARVYLEQWNAQSPGSPYILGLLARAQNALRDDEGALRSYEALAACDPRDCAVRPRLDAGMERLRAGVFPRGRVYRTYSVEGIGTASPQTIVYEGSSSGARFRAPLRAGLDLTGGAELRREAQLNYGSGLTYFDILEQAYTAGLNWRPAGGSSWEGEFGKSVVTDNKGHGVGYRLLNRARLAGAWSAGETDLKASLSSQPKFLRGSGTSQYFILLRETAARVEAARGLWGWDWLGRAGLYGYAGGASAAAYSLRALRELDPFVLQAGYAHGQQEYYSASSSGRLRYVGTDALSAGVRLYSEDRYRLAASYGRTFYADTNSLKELDFEATGWLPGHREFYGSYRFSLRDFRAPVAGYPSADEREHWLGAYWRRCRGRDWAALLGLERGFLRDRQLSYGAEKILGELDWYRGSAASLHLQGSRRVTTGRGRSYSLGLQGRWSF